MHNQTVTTTGFICPVWRDMHSHNKKPEKYQRKRKTTVYPEDDIFTSWLERCHKMSKFWSCVFLVTSWICFKTHSVSGACMSGRYGLDCNYTCHCDAANCEDVTGCSGSCKKGWSGPRCTTENVALLENAYQSSYLLNYQDVAEHAVDGNRYAIGGGPCIITGVNLPHTWWEVDLGRDYYIHKLDIYFRTDFKARRNGVHIYSSTEARKANTSHLCGAATINSPDVTTVTCDNKVRRNGVHIYSSTEARQTNTSHLCGAATIASPDVTTVTCDSTARYITLYQDTTNSQYSPPGEGAMDFCEVEVYVCDAGTFGDDCSKFCHCLNEPCNHATGNCTGGCKQNWIGQTCSECDSDHYGPLCGKPCSSRHCNVSRGQSSCDKQTGRCDNGCTPGWMEPDCLKECPAYTYGLKCANSCNQRKCLGNTSCDHVTGKCDHGCVRGYQDEDCRTMCPSGKYGFNCNMSCEKRNCADNSPCDKLNGICVNGCLKGWDLPDCVTECHNNTFGPSCLFKCSERFCKGDNSKCDIEDGVCQDGCQTGWKNANCTEKCDSGSYGPDCAFDCNKRHCQTKSASCNHVNGSCGGECENNYNGIDCTGCDGKYGPECSLSCSDRHCKNDNAPCDHVTGSCDGPCDAGYQGDACAGKCAVSTYGDNCTMSCATRKCETSDSCPHEDGMCVGGCISGYQGVDCLKAQAVTSNTDSTTIAVSVVAGVLFVLLVIVTSVLFWHLKCHRVKSDSYQQEMRKTNTNPPSQPTDPSAVEYEIVDRQDGGHNSSRAFCSQQVDTSRSANYGNSSTSRDQIDAQPRHSESEGGYVNAGQTNEYEKLDLSNSPQNDYDRITGV
ncbi:protein draper-like [Gigantopelta aegis]|uniref:protein draper-like n=1 Tax=Gigantopelta aegis TaxID=1735272 RepID=UPI001B88A573|nr:protein draper-like [Gigantopelta aegis]